MVNTSTVSVLVPVYNGEQHLAECLDSILAQDYTDLEILVADDGSTDGSVEIIKAYAARDARFRWWKNPRNLGLTGNSNACLKEARGAYIKFVHQDDYLLSPSAIRKLVSALEQHPEASLAGCQQHLTGTTSKPTLFSNRAGCFNGRRMIVTCLERNTNLMGQPTLTLFRRQQARRGFDERFTGFLDYEMWCHLLEQGDYVYLNEPLATWRVHQNHQTARARTSRVSEHEHLKFMEVYYAKPWLQEMATNRMLFTQIYYLRKNYGPAAHSLTSAMMEKLSLGGYAWQWLRHKASRPAEKLLRKIRAK